jgi:hypothetical protein
MLWRNGGISYVENGESYVKANRSGSQLINGAAYLAAAAGARENKPAAGVMLAATESHRQRIFSRQLLAAQCGRWPACGAKSARWQLAQLALARKPAQLKSEVSGSYRRKRLRKRRKRRK